MSEQKITPPETTPGMNEKVLSSWEYIKKYFTDNQRFPKISEISSAMNIDYNKTISILRILEINKMIVRWGSNYFIAGTGNNNRRKTIKKIPKKRVRKKKQVSNIKPIVLANSEYREKKLIKEKIDFEPIKIMTVKIVMAIVGMIAALISIQNSMLWFLSMMSWFRSFLFSICMIGFSIVAFEMIVLFRRSKQHVFSIIFSFLWGLVLIFCMTATVSGQYNQYHEKKEAMEKLNSNNNFLIYQELKEKEIVFLDEIESRKKERERIQKILSETFDDNEALKNRKTLIVVNREISGLNAALLKVKNEKEKLLKNSDIRNIENDDFFTWAGKILKINPLVIQFWLTLFPAIFIDLAAPLSFAVVVFYKKEGEK